MVLVHVGEIVEHQQIVFVELGDRRLQLEGLARRLQPLHDLGGAGEQHAVAVLDQSLADRGGTVARSRAGRPEQQQVGRLVEPSVAGRELP
jgi:hypothetical protein